MVGAEAAAQEIVATAEAWETALREIRQLRLGGKAAVRKAETIEAAEAAAKDFEAKLRVGESPTVEIVSACRKFCSARGPRIMPMITGAVGKSYFRIRKPIPPNT